MKELNMNEEAKVNGGYVDFDGKDPNYPYADGKTPNYPYLKGKEANYPYLNEAEMSAVSGGTGPLEETGPLNETGPLGYPYKDEIPTKTRLDRWDIPTKTKPDPCMKPARWEMRSAP